jgi:hypothetical protein
MAQASNVGDSYITDAGVGAGAIPDGWQLFAGSMILFAGIWNLLEGLFAFVRSSVFIGRAVFGDLWFWALLWILFGLLQVTAGYAIMSGRTWARWFGIIVIGLSALLTMLTIATYPFWALVMLAIDFAILYGLTARWQRRAEM